MYHAKFCMHETSLKYEIIYFLLLHVSTDHHKTTIGPINAVLPNPFYTNYHSQHPFNRQHITAIQITC